MRTIISIIIIKKYVERRGETTTTTIRRRAFTMWMYSTKDMRPRYTSFHTKSWMDRAVGVTTVIRLKIIQDMQSGRTEEKYMEVAQGHNRMWFSLRRGITASLWYKAKWAAPPHYRGGKQNPNLKENKTMFNDISSSHFNRLIADCPTALFHRRVTQHRHPSSSETGRAVFTFSVHVIKLSREKRERLQNLFFTKCNTHCRGRCSKD